MRLCPLMSRLHDEGFLMKINCAEEDCAWWDASTKKCAILSMGLF